MTYPIDIKGDIINNTDQRDTHCLISNSIVETYRIYSSNSYVNQFADINAFYSNF